MLISFATGSVSPVAAPVIAAHCDRCADCRAKALDAEAVGGALLESMPPMPLSPGALERTLERLDRLPHEVASDPQPFASWSNLIRADRTRLRWVAPGIRHAVLLRSPPETLRLLELRPGKALLQHTHQGKELTCVLQGAFSDETGYFGPGDFSQQDRDMSHRPVAVGSENCVCLVVTSGRLRFSSPIAKLIQFLLPI